MRSYVTVKSITQFLCYTARVVINETTFFIVSIFSKYISRGHNLSGMRKKLKNKHLYYTPFSNNVYIPSAEWLQREMVTAFTHYVSNRPCPSCLWQYCVAES